MKFSKEQEVVETEDVEKRRTDEKAATEKNII